MTRRPIVDWPGQYRRAIVSSRIAPSARSPRPRGVNERPAIIRRAHDAKGIGRYESLIYSGPIPKVPVWQFVSLAFFGHLLIVAAFPRGMGGPATLRVVAGALLGAALVAVSLSLPADGVPNVWVLPPLALLVGYWTSGSLFVAPMARAERLLARIDAALGVQAIAARMPRPLVELLELAYSGVYVLIPIALWLALTHGVTVDRFWTTILLTDYVCFGMLPWIQTRPPRALGFDTPWRSHWRTVNLRMLNASSVQVNTFPSGHAAEALACALLLSGGPAPVVAWMFLNAAAISAGTVFGRYHYAADALAGWVVALLVWTFISVR
jgi:membrane-associated phospholipid phosphatase